MIRVCTFLLGLCVIGCAPYTSFYKETYTANQDMVNQKVYRLVLNGSDSINNIPFESLGKLASLKLSNASSDQVNKVLEQLPNPEKLKILILDSLHMESLPASISRFTNLHQLSLNHNPQLNFEQTFKKIKDLPIEFLNIQHNELTELPASVTQLKHLKDLNLSHNTISGAEPFKLLAQLPELYSLWLTGNKLDSLPVSIGNLSQLKNLYIEHNQLIEIPQEVIHMEKVWVIHAGHNLFKELPAAFAVMPSLILLHANNCNIKSIPPIYATKESNVMGLIVDNNELLDNDKLKWKKIMNHYFLLSM